MVGAKSRKGSAMSAVPNAQIQGRGLAALPSRARNQADCDAIQAEARRNPDRPSILRAAPIPRLEPTDDLIDARLAEELAYAQRLLESLGDLLTNDPILLQRHQTTLQGVDFLGQMLGHLAKVVGSKDKGMAISRIGMQDLQARLARPTERMSALGP
jgi:hypothetical protein